MKKITFLVFLCTALISCEDEKVNVDERLVIKEIFDVTDNSRLSFEFNPDTTLSSLVKNNNNMSTLTWSFKYEQKRLSKISRTLKNVGSEHLIEEANDTIYFNYESNGMVGSIYIRNGDTDDLVEKIEYQYSVDNSLQQINYFNFPMALSETLELTFVNYNLTSLGDVSFQYDGNKNPINEIGLAYKDFYWGDFEFGTYFSKNNVTRTGDWEFVFSYNEFKYPTRIKSISGNRVWSDKIITYY